MSPLDWLARAIRAFGGEDGPEEACFMGREAPGTSGCREDCESVVLTELRPGARGVVTCLADPGSGDARKLAGMGILPGAPLELLRSYPAYVFRVGEADFALDGELASRIRVRAEQPRPPPQVPPARPSASAFRASGRSTSRR